MKKIYADADSHAYLHFECFGHIRDNEVHGLSRQYTADLVKEVMLRSCNEIYDMVCMIHS